MFIIQNYLCKWKENYCTRIIPIFFHKSPQISQLNILSLSPCYFSITSWFTYWINLGDIILKGIWQASNENSCRLIFWQRGTLTIHIYIILIVQVHQCEYVCLLLWKRWKANFNTKYWLSLSQKNSHFTMIYFCMVILLQKRVRELITALPLMSYMAFEMLGSNS